MKRDKKHKGWLPYGVIISTTTSLITIGIVAYSSYIPYPDISTIIISSLTILVTILIGWNIFSLIDFISERRTINDLRDQLLEKDRLISKGFEKSVAEAKKIIDENTTDIKCRIYHTMATFYINELTYLNSDHRQRKTVFFAIYNLLLLARNTTLEKYNRKQVDELFSNIDSIINESKTQNIIMDEMDRSQLSSMVVEIKQKGIFSNHARSLDEIYKLCDLE